MCGLISVSLATNRTLCLTIIVSNERRIERFVLFRVILAMTVWLYHRLKSMYLALGDIMQNDTVNRALFMCGLISALLAECRV